MTGAFEMFRSYRNTDYDQVAELWTRINRELAPAGMRDLFEQYIATALAGELRRAQKIFSPARRNGLWVVLMREAIVGTFGIENRSKVCTELRRMYLDQRYRGTGLARRMLQHAEDRARDLGFSTMILSTAEVQKAAIAFYQKAGYTLVRTEIANTMSTKTVGAGLTRFHFAKTLQGNQAAGPVHTKNEQ